jgi:electron transfer flavoprotein beta subunit
MKIVVCVKQVPATHEVSIDPETKRIRREGVEAEMNPFDLYAVEQGVQLVERLGGETIAVSMGPPQAEAALREALSMGVDRAVLLSDKAFAGSDTWATSYALACAVGYVGDVDLVLCGKQAIDGDTAQVGPGIAAHLGWPQVTYVSAMPEASAGRLVVARMNEEGCETVEVRLPAVLTVVKDLNVPRVPTLRSCLAARKAEVPVVKAETIGAETDRLGLHGSPTRVVRIAPPPPRSGGTQIITGTARQCAETIVKELRNRSVL